MAEPGHTGPDNVERGLVEDNQVRQDSVLVAIQLVECDRSSALEVVVSLTVA